MHIILPAWDLQYCAFWVPLSGTNYFACDSEGNKLNIIFVWLTSADD